MELALKPTFKYIKYGAIAGFIATWTISTAIAVVELDIGLEIGTFYSILGIIIGTNNLVLAPYLGFGLHLVTGTAIGAIAGFLASKYLRSYIQSPLKGTVIGIAAGILVWAVLFMPVTALLIQPSLPRVVFLLAVDMQEPIISNDIDTFVQTISTSAILFHLVWGALFGFITSSLLKIKTISEKSRFEDPDSSRSISTIAGVSISFGLLSGLLSSLAISALLMLSEKTLEIPVGTFYLMITSALFQTQNYSLDMILSGFLMHTAAGSFMGMLISLVMTRFSNRGYQGLLMKYAPVYGLAAGFVIWSALFLPITLTSIIPIIQSQQSDIPISQRLPTGIITYMTTKQVSEMITPIVAGALAFNMFYGMLCAIINKSLHNNYESRIRKIPVDRGASTNH